MPLGNQAAPVLPWLQEQDPCPPHLRDFTVRLLGLVEIDRDGSYVLYVPDPARIDPNEEAPDSTSNDELVP